MQAFETDFWRDNASRKTWDDIVPGEPRLTVPYLLTLEDAVQLIESKRHPDNRWVLDRAYDEALALTIGESVGATSRWNTLRALRVLRWYGA
jgi:hypothetical protein